MPFNVVSCFLKQIFNKTDKKAQKARFINEVQRGFLLTLQIKIRSLQKVFK